MLVNPKNYNHTAKSLKGHTLKKRIQQTSNQLIPDTINKEDNINIKAIEFCNTLTSSVAQILLKKKKKKLGAQQVEEEPKPFRKAGQTFGPSIWAHGYNGSYFVEARLDIKCCAFFCCRQSVVSGERTDR